MLTKVCEQLSWKLTFQNGGTFEENLQMELARLSSENLEQQALLESLEKQNRKLKRQLKLYNKKLNTLESM